MGQLLFNLFLIPLMLFTPPLSSGLAQSQQAVVHAILFYSPSCGQCHYVITETLPPLFEKYGTQLYIVGVDVTQAGGQALFLAALEYYKVERTGVPFLAVGAYYLTGSVDIPEKFPGLIDQYLAAGGVGWPPIPGLAEAMAAPAPAETPTEGAPQAEPTTAAQPPPQATLTATPAATETSEPIPPTATPGIIMGAGSDNSLAARFARDRLGNSLAVIVLAGMVFSLGGVVLIFRQNSTANAARAFLSADRAGLILFLCLIGLGVAGYLSFVETAKVEAVCGPVGDCNTVQQSSYARLFGILPIGILGLVGYVLILAALGAAYYTRGTVAAIASLAMAGMATFGLLFSIYLTFLEPFVIGATCAWCLTSAILMTALFWLSLAPAGKALTHLINKPANTAVRKK